jgi:hypothetical protein
MSGKVIGVGSYPERLEWGEQRDQTDEEITGKSVEEVKARLKRMRD